MTRIALEDAWARLAALIDALAPDEEVGITRGGHLVARLVRLAPPSGTHEPSRAPAEPPDDDEHLGHFRD